MKFKQILKTINNKFEYIFIFYCILICIMNKHTDIKVFKRILCNTNIGLMTNNSPNITDYFKVDKKP